MKVEMSICYMNDFLLGIMTAEGEDEEGPFNMLSIGILLFEISFIKYKKL